MKQQRVVLVAGARPNFMKVAPLYHKLSVEGWCRTAFVHAGQHYDPEMSDTFLRELSLPKPDANLSAESGTHAQQTGKVLIAFEEYCLDQRPDLVVVVGDVNSTLACALASVKIGIRVAHLEAGLRSFDRLMPEEINRVVTDRISDHLWTPSPDADENLLAEGIDGARIERVGNIMIDAYELLRDKIEATEIVLELGLTDASYAVVTMHRPSNVDDPAKLSQIAENLVRVAEDTELVFPMHPRTKRALLDSGLHEQLEQSPGITLLSPLPYTAFMSLVGQAAFVLTDSGGVQEETTYLGIPCLTLRDSTERPITVTEGTNRLIGIGQIQSAVGEALVAQKGSRKPDLWDGHTASRVVSSIRRFLTE